MKVSIVTPSYNSASTILDTVRSVNAQIYADIEHIVIDGGSLDSTVELVKQHDRRSLTLVSEKDGGIYDAMNKGIALASGEVVAILNSDDFYASEDVIQKVVDAFEQSGAEIVYGDILIVDPSNTANVWRYWKSGRFSRGRTRRGWAPPHPAFFVRRSVYERWGRFRLNFPISADYEFMLRVLYKEKIKAEYIPEILTIMRGGGNSTKSVRQYVRGWEEIRRAWRINGLRVPCGFTILRPLLKIPQYFRGKWFSKLQ